MTSPAEDETAISSWLLANAKVKLFSNSLSSAEACFWPQGAGDKEKRKRGGRWEGDCETLRSRQVCKAKAVLSSTVTLIP